MSSRRHAVVVVIVLCALVSTVFLIANTGDSDQGKYSPRVVLLPLLNVPKYKPERISNEDENRKPTTVTTKEWMSTEIRSDTTTSRKTTTSTVGSNTTSTGENTTTSTVGSNTTSTGENTTTSTVGSNTTSTEGRSDSTQKFLFADFHASKYGGGVGNFVFEWISFLGIARTLGRVPAVHIRDSMVIILLKWQKHFPNIMDEVVLKQMTSEKRVDFPYPGCCKYEDPKKVYQSSSQDPVVFSGYSYLQSFKYFENHSREELLNILQFHENEKKLAREEMLANEFVNRTTNVCVHIRRGDFVSSSLHQHSTEDFTAAAIRFAVQHVRNTTEAAEVSAILLGNDLEWEENLIKSMGSLDFPLHAVRQNKKYWAAHIDWVFAQLYCDTTVLTASASTYGWWMAYLARGSEVFYNENFSKPNGIENELDPDVFFPPLWTKIRLDRQKNAVVIA